MLKRFYYVVAGLVCAIVLLGCSDDEIDVSKLVDGPVSTYPLYIQLVNEEGENILLKHSHNSLYGQKLIIRQVGSDSYENVSWSGPLPWGGGSGKYNESGRLIGLSKLISSKVPKDYTIEFPDIKKCLHIKADRFDNGLPPITVNNYTCEDVQDSIHPELSRVCPGYHTYHLTINFWDVAADSE